MKPVPVPHCSQQIPHRLAWNGNVACSARLWRLTAWEVAQINYHKYSTKILHTIKRRKAKWIGHILHRNWLLNRVFERKVKGTTRWGRRYKQLLDDLKEKILENEKESTRSHSLERLLWNMLWTCRKTDYVMTMTMTMIVLRSKWVW
jgi:hypothetical protein